jgi:glucose/mannose-6-phosphate isomerase
MNEILKKLESSKYASVFASIKLVPEQFRSTLDQKIVFSKDFKTVKNIVLCGMGGSALAGHILQALNVSLAPFCFYNGYEPLAYVGSDTLFIASSYSGNTEEVLASVEVAKKRGAKIVGLTAGGVLAEWFSKNKLPLIRFDEQFNPSGQPRYGLGYALGALFNIFIQLGFMDLKMSDVGGAISKLKEPEVADAAHLAIELRGFAPIVAASGFLEGNAHVLVNQINETCKTFSEWHSIPELNHHLMEGLKRPAGNKYLKFLFIESDLYSKAVAARVKITKDVVQKNKISYTVYKTNGKTKLEQVLNFLTFGSLVGLILSIDYGENPTAIPWVDYFKKQLKSLAK